MLSAILLFVFVSVELSLTASSKDPCHLSNLYSNQTLHDKPLMNVTIQPKCTEGEFDWDWPQGYIYLSVTLPTRLTLCVWKPPSLELQR
ncbi:hypothetical protein Btru_042332 [Bulinus truncatus]|nr:hypothetical protein Btru_042332 [Bulinus truncatus]